MVIYDGIFDFRSAYLNQGKYENSSSATFPYESDSIWPYYDSTKPTSVEQVTMTYLGHDPVVVGDSCLYEKFQLYIQNPNGGLPAGEKITDIWIDCGKGFLYMIGRPIISVDGIVKTDNIIHYNLTSKAVADSFNPKAQYLATGDATTIDFSFTPSNTSLLLSGSSDSIGINSNNKTHAVVVLIQDVNGYKTFGHYAVANPWNYYNLTQNAPKYLNASGGWVNCSLNASSCFTMPWIDPSVRPNKYRFNFTVIATGLPAGVDRKYRIGFKSGSTNISPFLATTNDYDLYNTTIPELQIDAESNTAGGNYLDPRTTACKTVIPFFVAPVYSSTTIPTISANGYRTGDPTVIRDWYTNVIAP